MIRIKSISMTALLAFTIIAASATYAQNAKVSTNQQKGRSATATRTGQTQSTAVKKTNSTVANPVFVEPEMVLVEGGAFTMGEDKEAHKVTLSSFYIGKYEVTQALWKAIMGNNPSHFKGNNLPVETVSWDDVQEFIKKLNAKTGKQYRLPTEAEWEYAARGGNKSKGYKYSGSNNPDEVAWYNTSFDTTTPIDHRKIHTHPIGTKKPNELGIYDMSGNVMEWCNDYDQSSPYPKKPQTNAQTNPQGPASGNSRVRRSSDYSFDAVDVYTSSPTSPDFRDPSTGFRLAYSAK